MGRMIPREVEAIIHGEAGPRLCTLSRYELHLAFDRSRDRDNPAPKRAIFIQRYCKALKSAARSIADSEAPLDVSGFLDLVQNGDSKVLI
jgi:hypothetical protein